jgi:hypothetical protein
MLRKSVTPILPNGSGIGNKGLVTGVGKEGHLVDKPTSNPSVAFEILLKLGQYGILADISNQGYCM